MKNKKETKKEVKKDMKKDIKKENKKQNTKEKNKENKENKNIEKDLKNDIKEKDTKKENKVEIKKAEVKNVEENNENIFGEGNKNIAVYGPNMKDNNYFFEKAIINFKKNEDNKGERFNIVESKFNYIKNFTVEETLDYTLELLSMNYGDVVENVDSIISKMEIEDLRKMKMKSLSDFTLRKVNIANALTLNPDYLFVYNDLNLTNEERKLELALLRKLSKELEFKLIYLTTNKDEILDSEKIVEVK